jgi:xanthine/CO dehydrogenase XdhC/CoxF family maturation factor
VTPAEIAISIVAELVAIRRGVDTKSLSMSSKRPALRNPAS